MAVKPLAHIILCGLLDILEIASDDRHSIRMVGICHPEKQMPHIAVWTVETYLLELLHHYRTLHFQGFVGECQRQHAVTLKPEGGLDVVGRDYVVETGEVVGCPGVG